MATVWVPSLMRDLTGGQERVHAPGRTVGQVIDALAEEYPGFRERLCDGDRLDPAYMVSVDGRIGPLGLRERVREESEISFLPAVGGG
jgi:molybdopterin converting factor small subunit